MPRLPGGACPIPDRHPPCWSAHRGGHRGRRPTDSRPPHGNLASTSTALIGLCPSRAAWWCSDRATARCGVACAGGSAVYGRGRRLSAVGAAGCRLVCCRTDRLPAVRGSRTGATGARRAAAGRLAVAGDVAARRRGPQPPRAEPRISAARGGAGAVVGVAASPPMPSALRRRRRWRC